MRTLLAVASSELVSRILIAVVGVSYGLFLLGVGQLFTALREIALNTRSNAKERSSVSSYSGLLFVGGVLGLVGILVILGAILVAVAGGRVAVRW